MYTTDTQSEKESTLLTGDNFICIFTEFYANVCYCMFSCKNRLAEFGNCCVFFTVKNRIKTTATTTTLTLIFSCLFSLIFLSCTFAFHRYDLIFKKSLVGGTGLVKFPAKTLTRILVKNQQQQLTINDNKWQTTTKTKRESMFTHGIIPFLH